ncbi:MAG: cytochrome b/b6 domain-containing protein [Devosiaceae bacterium]|nr:cytochrome b/b6 domain-containing protein [Devosiaceae bacterium]
MKKQPDTYSKIQIYLHWITVALIAFQFLLHGEISVLFRARMEGFVPNIPTLSPHAIVGTIMLIVILWRLWLRFKYGVPAVPKSKKLLAKLGSKAMHISIYVLLIANAFFGLGAWVFGLQFSSLLHIITAYALLTIIYAHIFAALFHHFVLKNNVLKRIVGKS